MKRKLKSAASKPTERNQKRKLDPSSAGKAEPAIADGAVRVSFSVQQSGGMVVRASISALESIHPSSDSPVSYEQ